MSIRDSYGIALCRLPPERAGEVLLVRKRCSYAFVRFVTSGGRVNVAQLLAAMSAAELALVRGLDYAHMWFHLHGNLNRADVKFIRCSQAFHRRFLQRDGGKSLCRLAETSPGRGTLGWELPRGAAYRSEVCVDAALRELLEETGAPRSAVRLVPGVHRTYVVSSAGRRYRMTYFFAIAQGQFAASSRPSAGRGALRVLGEIDEVRWATARDALLLAGPLVARVVRAAVRCSRAFRRGRLTTRLAHGSRAQKDTSPQSPSATSPAPLAPLSPPLAPPREHVLVRKQRD